MSTAPIFEKALAAMRGKKAVLLGDLMLDAYLYGETVRVSREAPVLVVRKERVEHRLGGAANTAANLAALGLDTTVVGLVGDDEYGGVLSDMLHKAGAKVDALRRAPSTTPVKTRVLAGAFGTSRQQVLRIDDEPRALSEGELRVLADDVLARGKQSAVVVVSDYGLGLASPIIIDALQTLTRNGVFVCVDSRYQMRDFVGVTAVTPNLPEAESFVGHRLNAAADVERAGRSIVERLSCSACLVTQGRGGMSLFRPNTDTQHVDIVGEEEVTDVTGAGDTVIAAFSAAMAAGLGMENGMLLANLAAGIVVTKAGTATASAAELIQAAKRYNVALMPWQ